MKGLGLRLQELGLALNPKPLGPLGLGSRVIALKRCRLSGSSRST